MKNLISKDISRKQIFPYPLIIALFAVMAIIYVSPILEGKKINQPDIVKFEGMSKEVKDFREETGEEALWTNSMFGGMPAFQISVEYPNNISNFLHNVMTLWLPRPADMIFLYFAGFFIFLLLLRLNPWLAFLGAVAFALSSYNFIIISAGHNSKAVAIAYMAPVLGSIIHTFRGKYLTGGILFAIFLSLQLFANHYQITYYLLIIVVFYGLFELIRKIRQGESTKFFKALGILVLAAILSIGINFSRIWTTYEYTEETMRGGSELSLTEKTKGLDIDYITAWSYGVAETFSLIIPNIKGGETKAIGENKSAMEEVDPRFKNEIARQNHYWGDQPFTSGPVYVGAIVIFFFILSLFYIKGPIKYGLLAATILSIMLAWGKNFLPLTELFVNYVPGYDKFRAVSMTLTIAAFCIPALAALGISKIIEKPEIFNYKNKYIYIAFGLSGGLALIFYLMPSAFFSFISETESQAIAAQKASNPELANQLSLFVDNLTSARINIFRADAIRSFLFVTVAAAFVIIFSMKKFSYKVFVLGITALIIIDMWTIDRRYMNDDNFESKRRVEKPFTKTKADDFILKDSDVGVRVLDLTESTFNSSRTSYFHQSIGGYHGAKLQRYQDIIDFYISKNINELISELNQQISMDSIYALLKEMPVLNMLNTRYIIINPGNMPLINMNAIGNAWFVSDYIVAENPDDELLLLKDIDPENTAIIDKSFKDNVSGLTLNHDTTAEIDLIDYQPNKLKYTSNNSEVSLAVFSEIYYPKGWNVTINGEQAEHFRANYILRAMVIPAGENEIIFEFKPKSYFAGENIALAFSILLVLLVLSYLGYKLYKHHKCIDKKSDNIQQ